MSDEEAQEITRLLSPKDKPSKWQSENLIPETASGPNSLIQDSSISGPVSLNDSLGPPSLQEESITETISEPASYVGETIVKESITTLPLDTYPTIGGTQDDIISKMDTSVSTCDSGLIGTVF